MRNNRKLKQSIMALAFVTAGALAAAPAIAQEGETGDSQENRQTYMDSMEQRIDETQQELDARTETAENDLQAAWDKVKVEWQDLTAAADENWEDAKASMNAAWQDFQREWDETFGGEAETTQ